MASPKSVVGVALFRQSHLIVLSSFLITLIVFGAQFSFGVFFKPVMAEFGWTRAMTSGAYSLYTILQGAFAILAGRISDRFGPRLVVSVCGLIFGLSYIFMSQAETVWHIYLLYGVLSAIGSAGCWVPLLSTSARWFTRRRGIVTGIIASGIGMGTIIVPPVANQLILAYGWRASYLIVGLAALIVSVASAQLLRRGPSYPAEVLKRPAQSTGSITEMKGFSCREAFKTRQFWIMCVSFFCLNFAMQTTMVHIAPYATDTGLSSATAASILSVIGGISIGSKIIMGNAVDRFGSKHTISIAAILMAGAYIWLRLTSEIWTLYFFAFIFAVAYGGFVALQSPMVAEFFGLRAHGTLLGILVFDGFSGGAIGPLVASRIFDTNGTYQLAFSICAVISLIALIAVLALKPTPSLTLHE